MSQWLYLKVGGFKYYQVTLRLFQIIESESFHLKAVEENPPAFTALLLFKAWQNLKCKTPLIPKHS